MIILVDGHNLIPKLRGFSLKAIDDEMKLVDLLQIFSRVRRTKVEVFFDGAPPGQAGTRSFGTIQAHFVRIGETADEAIRLKLDQLGPQARETLVITSDHRVQGEARAHKAKSRQERFYDIEERAKQRRNNDKVQLDIKASYLGSKIFEAKYITKVYGDLKILDNFYYNFARFEKMGIVGKNGTGKSTFLKMLLGEVKPDSGSFDIGETVVFGYYSQDGLAFDEQMKVIDVVQDIAEEVSLGNGKKMSASQFLQHFLFTPETQHNYVYKLSGGERRRLHLCTVLMRNPNFLVLDEPTNDLDIVTLNVLEEYLQSFKGCVIVVSHDRYFMDKVVDHLLVFKGNAELKDFPGNYTDYREWNELMEEEEREEKKAQESRTKNQEPRQQPTASNQQTATKRKLSFKEKQEFEALEKEIPELEAEKAEIENQLASGTLSSDEIIKASQRHAEVNDLIDEKTMRWLELSEI